MELSLTGRADSVLVPTTLFRPPTHRPVVSGSTGGLSDYGPLPRSRTVRSDRHHSEPTRHPGRSRESPKTQVKERWGEKSKEHSRECLSELPQSRLGPLGLQSVWSLVVPTSESLLHARDYCFHDTQIASLTPFMSFQDSSLISTDIRVVGLSRRPLEINITS